MFSSTTIASSMTMPTDSVSASIVMQVEREAHVPDQAERGDDRGRDGDRGDDRRAQVAQEQQHDERGEDRADDQVLLDVVDRRLDELRRVADDAQRRSRPAASACSSSSRSLTALTTSTVFVPDCRRTCSSTVPVPLTLATVSGSASPSSTRATSPTRTGWPSFSRTTMSLNSATRLDAAARPQRDRLRALVDAAARESRRSATAARARRR